MFHQAFHDTLAEFDNVLQLPVQLLHQFDIAENVVNGIPSDSYASKAASSRSSQHTSIINFKL